MKLLNISSQNKIGRVAGITLIETLVVLGLLSIIAGFSLYSSMDSWRGFSFRNDRDMLIAILQKVRSQSVNNMCFGSSCSGGKPHGIHFQSGSYVVFQGPSWASRDPAFDEVIQISNATVQITSTSPEIVFSQLSGDADPGQSTTTVADTVGHVSVISINSEGGMMWTN